MTTTRPQMSEADLQSAVLDLAHVLGWVAAHFRPGLTRAGNWRTPVAADAKGFPDCVLVRERVLYVELKSSRGRLSPQQVWWGQRLRAAGAQWECWGPDDWCDGTIERELTKRAVGRAERGGW